MAFENEITSIDFEDKNALSVPPYINNSERKKDNIIKEKNVKSDMEQKVQSICKIRSKR